MRMNNTEAGWKGIEPEPQQHHQQEKDFSTGITVWCYHLHGAVTLEYSHMVIMQEKWK